MTSAASRPATNHDEAECLRRFRTGFHRSWTRWADAGFELCEAMLCSPAPVSSMPMLSLEPCFRRSHGSLYRSLSRGEVDAEALRDLLVAHRPVGWPLVFAVDASTWARCDAETSPERGFYYSASKHSAGQPIVAGWSYQWITQLDWSCDSWTAPMDASRIPPNADTVEVTAAQVRDLVARLGPTQTTPTFVFDAGYDPVALTHELADTAANLVVRIRDDRVFYTDPPTPEPGTTGRPRRHGERRSCARADSWPTPDEDLSAEDLRYGTVRVSAWHGLHPKLAGRGRWATHDQPPIVRGTVVRVEVEHLPNPPADPRRRCGCGRPAPTSTSTSAGGPTCAASTSSTPSGSSRTRWVGPHLGCAPPSRPTHGPGSSSPPTHSSASPAGSLRTSVCPGNDEDQPAN
jgi:hypothetical protein